MSWATASSVLAKPGASMSTPTRSGTQVQRVRVRLAKPRHPATRTLRLVPERAAGARPKQQSHLSSSMLGFTQTREPQTIA